MILVLLRIYRLYLDELLLLHKLSYGIWHVFHNNLFFLFWILLLHAYGLSLPLYKSMDMLYLLLLNVWQMFYIFLFFLFECMVRMRHHRLDFHLFYNRCLLSRLKLTRFHFLFLFWNRYLLFLK